MIPGQPQRSPNWIFFLSPILVALFVSLAWFVFPVLRQHLTPEQGVLPDVVSAENIELATPFDTNPPLTEDFPTPQPTNSPIAASSSIELPADASPIDRMNAQGVLILSMRDGAFLHLFAYHPLYLPLTRLTNTPWDDMTPALSPDGKRLAFSARQNGYWDLYLLNLESGMRTRLTDTPDFESAPTWAPDGQWIAYQRFDGASLEIELLPVQDPAGVIRLTDSPGLDYEPAWSPQGRQIAFVSDRSGDEEIWIADLDRVEDRYTNVSQNTTAADRHPSFSRDGRLVWSSEKAGARRLVVWQPGADEAPTLLPVEGARAVWSPDGALLFSELRGPNQADLTAYHVATGRIGMQPVPLPGALYGMTWVPGPLPAKLLEAIRQGDQSPPPVLYRPILSNVPIAPAGRIGLVPLTDVTAPQPMLHDEVDEAFNDLRAQVGLEAGWDALSSLENAFVAVTTPNDPANEDEWLYTGRAFALNPLLASAGWITVAREEFGGQTYWRVYLKARYQDGSMGMPIPQMAFDLNARYSGSTRPYEQGGRVLAPPPGYWVDLTELAMRYGWERLPSLTGWRTYYPSIRHNQFVISGGLDWQAAMAQLYPAEALVTNTPQPTYTPLDTVTPGTPAPADPPTPQPSVTPIPTRRPTWTPLPNFSP